MINYYILLIFSWTIYFFVHSALATTIVKKVLSLDSKSHRLLYSGISIVGLIVIVYLLYMHSSDYIWDPGTPSKILAVLLSLAAGFIGYKSFRPYSLTEFLGLKKESTHSDLNKNGLYAYVRHPLYSSLILLLLALFIYYPTHKIFISILANMIYLPFGIYFEEKKLIEKFGKAYEIYRKQVPAIIPRLSHSSSS